MGTANMEGRKVEIKFTPTPFMKSILTTYYKEV